MSKNAKFFVSTPKAYDVGSKYKVNERPESKYVDICTSTAIDAEATGRVQQGRLLRLDILHLKVLKTGFRGALSAVKISKNAEGVPIRQN